MMPLPYPFIDQVHDEVSDLHLRSLGRREARRWRRAARWRALVRRLASIAIRERGNPRGVPDV